MPEPKASLRRERLRRTLIRNQRASALPRTCVSLPAFLNTLVIIRSGARPDRWVAGPTARRRVCPSGVRRSGQLVSRFVPYSTIIDWLPLRLRSAVNCIESRICWSVIAELGTPPSW